MTTSAQILYLAADIANRAWAKELEDRAWGTAKSPLAAHSVQLWDAVLQYYPDDDDGECRERRAWALMASGRLDEAVAQANEVRELRGNTLRYAYNYARLMSVRGNTDKSFEWFSYAVKTLGFNAVGLAQ